MKEPTNLTYLSAELTLALGNPVVAAMLATELIRLGKRYFRLSERLCNEPDPEERLGKARSRVRARIEKAIADLEAEETVEIEQTGDGLALQCNTLFVLQGGTHGTTASTVLR